MAGFGKPNRIGSYRMTLQEVAKELGISHQAVSEAEQRAIRKFRAEMLKHGITYRELELCLKLWL